MFAKSRQNITRRLIFSIQFQFFIAFFFFRELVGEHGYARRGGEGHGYVYGHGSKNKLLRY